MVNNVPQVGNRTHKTDIECIAFESSQDQESLVQVLSFL